MEENSSIQVSEPPNKPQVGGPFPFMEDTNKFKLNPE
jgi:hypothetical protein